MDRSPDRWLQRLQEMGISWHVPPSPAGDAIETAAALTERIKELNCLYAISQLIDRKETRLEDFLAMAVDILPPSWQFPEIACSRIVFEERQYQSLYYRETDWRMSAPITYQGKLAGLVTVFYTEPRPDQDEGPFVKEERYLINAVAERIGRIASRKETETRLAEINRQLATERTSLREVNAALRVVLSRIEEEKAGIQEDIQENVRKILLPVIREMAVTVPPEHTEYLNLLEDNLNQITSPFVRRISTDYRALTTTEIRICDMIRSGMGSKEIALLRGVSPATISRHREHIRRKLGIANSKVNLTTYLQSTM